MLISKFALCSRVDASVTKHDTVSGCKGRSVTETVKLQSQHHLSFTLHLSIKSNSDMLAECDSASADCPRRRMKDVKCKCQSALTCCSPSSLFSLFCHCSACITIASHLRFRLIDSSCRASQCCSASGPTSAMGPDCPRGGECRKQFCQNYYKGYYHANHMIRRTIYKLIYEGFSLILHEKSKIKLILMCFLDN